MTRPTCLILTGTGVHADRWHNLAATSAAVTAVLGDKVNCQTVLTTDAARTGLPAADVVVVNVSGIPGAVTPDAALIVDALVGHSARRGAILGLHTASLAFGGDPRWGDLLGGSWVAGLSGHPQIGHAVVQSTAVAGADVPAAADFVVYDERYTGLAVAAHSRILALHTEDGMTHPLVWAVEGGATRGRVVYDGLGHGAESYDSSGHRALLRECLRWLMSGTV